MDSLSIHPWIRIALIAPTVHVFIHHHLLMHVMHVFNYYYHQLLELFRSLFDKDQMSPEGGADRSMDLAHLLREYYSVESFHHLS